MAMIRAVLIGLVLSQPAHALSCLRPDPVRSYLDRVDQPGMVVLLGRFDFPHGAISQPTGVGDPMPQERDFPARFRGENLLTGEGLDGQLNLVGRCFASWCGDMVPGVHLAFGQMTDAGLEVSVDPCGTAAFPDPDIATLARLQRCVESGACSILE